MQFHVGTSGYQRSTVSGVLYNVTGSVHAAVDIVSGVFYNVTGSVHATVYI